MFRYQQPPLIRAQSQRVRPRSRRAAATMVEMAVVLGVFVMVILGTFDLGIAAYRFNTISQAARQGARRAIVHGKLASPAMTVWGPATYNGKAGDGSIYAQAVSPMLVGFPLNDVDIKVEWLDGGNAIQQRVRYTVTTTWRPILTSSFSQSGYVQKAASTMPIAH